MNLYDYMDVTGRIHVLEQQVAALRDNVSQDTKAAMYALANATESLSAIAVELVEQGVHEGMTQAAMARALNIPASSLRGARKELAR